MEFIDLKAQQLLIRKQIETNIRAVLDHGRYIMGPEIASLEARLAQYVGVRHAIACSSGTDALLMALMASGVGPGDIVLTSPFTFIATAEVIQLLGAVPVFVDIDPATFNMDAEQTRRAVKAVEKNDDKIYPLPKNLESGHRLKGIMPVDLFGLPADYDTFAEIAKAHNLFLIEDAAQSFGAIYKGKKACSLGHVAGTSFFPAKPLGCYGDGGMCFTDSDKLADIMRSIRIHGTGRSQYDNARIGVNGRMDTLQAAVLHAKFDIFPAEVQKRQQVADRYARLLNAAVPNLKTPVVPESLTSVWAQYSVLARDEARRSDLQQKLKNKGIPTAVYYPKPLHLQTAFAALGYREGNFPVSEDAARRIFSLPMHPYLTEETQEQIAAAMK